MNVGESGYYSNTENNILFIVPGVPMMTIFLYPVQLWKFACFQLFGKQKSYRRFLSMSYTNSCKWFNFVWYICAL